MGGVKTDIEIARSAKMKPIGEVLAKVNIPDNPLSFSPMGRHIAKLNFEYMIFVRLLHNIYLYFYITYIFGGFR